MASKSLEILLSINTVGTVVLGILSAVLFTKLYNSNNHIGEIEQNFNTLKSDLTDIRGSKQTLNNGFGSFKNLKSSHSEAFFPTIGDCENVYLQNISELSKKSRPNIPLSMAPKKIVQSNSMSNFRTIHKATNIS